MASSASPVRAASVSTVSRSSPIAAVRVGSGASSRMSPTRTGYRRAAPRARSPPPRRSGRVGVVDDPPVDRRGLTHLISGAPDRAVWGERDPGGGGLAMIGAACPDVVIVAGDVFDRPDPPAGALVVLSRGLELLRASLPDTPVLMVAGPRDTPRRPGDPGPPPPTRLPPRPSPDRRGQPSRRAPATRAPRAAESRR